jgi:catechol 2,3-dioxygenase-like lactoylglutathione lyase family enzyme
MGEQATMAPAVTGYHHLGLTVCDVDRSEQWYGRVFGFQRAFVEPHHEGTGYAVVMNVPGTSLFLGLDKHDAHEGEQFAEHRTGLDHLAIGVATREALDTWVGHLDALGVEHSGITDISEPFPAATLCFRDPDNIALELMWM